MIYINKRTWKRREHFNFFLEAKNPHFGVTNNVDVTKLLQVCRKNKKSFFDAFLFCLMKSINQIDELKVRPVKKKLVQYVEVSPSFTILGDDQTFNFCTSNFNDDFQKFSHNARAATAKVKKSGKLNLDDDHRLDVIYCTCLPWFSFSSISFAMHNPGNDFIPRLAWGKFFSSQKKQLMPVAIQVHHSLVDGFHLGRFYQALEDNLSQCQKFIK